MDNRFVIYGLNAQVWDVAALLTALCHAAPESNAATPKHLTLALPQLLQSTSSLLVRHKKKPAPALRSSAPQKKKMGRRVLPSVDEVPMRTIAPTGGVTPIFFPSCISRILATTHPVGDMDRNPRASSSGRRRNVVKPGVGLACDRCWASSCRPRVRPPFEKSWFFPLFPSHLTSDLARHPRPPRSLFGPYSATMVIYDGWTA